MATDSGYPSQKKDERLKSEFVTIQPVGENRHALDVNVSMYNQIISDADLIDAVITEDNGDIFKLTVMSHGAMKGDLIHFKNGNQQHRQIRVWEVLDSDTIVLSETIKSSEPLPMTGDEIDILRPVHPRTNAEGDIFVTFGGLTFQKDGSLVLVNEDTVTPANNDPLPVKLTDITGDVNITANDLNISSDHTNDSISLGDGTVLFTAGSKAEANSLPVALSTEDNAALDAINSDTTSIDAKLPASLGQKASASSLPTVLSTEQEAILSSMDSSLTSIDTDTTSIRTEVSSLNGKVTLGQFGRAGSIAVVFATEQEAILSSIDSSLSSIDGDTTDIVTNTLGTAINTTQINGKLPATLGQKASADSMAVVLSSEQEAMIDGLEALLTTIDADTSSIATDASTIAGDTTSIDGKLPAALGQQTQANSLSVTLASDQVVQNASFSPVDFLDSGLVDTSVTNITTGGGVQVVASLAADVKKIQIIEDIGEFMSLKTSGGSLIAYLPLGGGEVKVSIPSATVVHLVSETGSTINSGKIAINFLG